ncbi:hypothetical protein AB0A69_00820 [Streptomyces sp. NPDC045431]|uniref:hypothetical protein n=1 Tax=Streptomyces sp. NPDC045431 TaxID=3155613 RepID=UPI00340B0204
MGLATAHRLLAEGAHVVVTGRTRARVDAAVRQLGPRASGVVADTADLGACTRRPRPPCTTWPGPSPPRSPHAASASTPSAPGTSTPRCTPTPH